MTDISVSLAGITATGPTLPAALRNAQRVLLTREAQRAATLPRSGVEKNREVRV